MTQNQNKALEKAMTKLAGIRADLQLQLLEQEEAIDLALTAFVNREHLALVGPAGEGKTHLADRFATYTPGKHYYHLLTRYTVPDEVVGHFSLAKLQKDQYERKTDGKALEAQTVCLDEVFKANSPMLNSLLGFLNERRVDGINARLDSCIGISNEWPRGINTAERHGDDESLRPLWDRFVYRYEITQPQGDDTFEAIVRNSLPQPSAPRLDSEDVKALHDAVAEAHAKWTTSMMKAFKDIKAELAARNVHVSSRRWYKASKAVCAYAIVQGRTQPTTADIKVLRHILWMTPGQRDVVAEVVMEAGSPETALALAIEAEVVAAYNRLKETADRAEHSAQRDNLLGTIRTHTRELKSLREDENTTDKAELLRVEQAIRNIGDSLLAEIAALMS